MAQVSAIELIDGTKRGIRAGAIPFGRCDSSSTATAFTATVPGVNELTDGTCVMLDNGVITSASGFTLNVNGLGAKPVYSNLAAATRDTTIFNVAYTMLFVYDEERVSGGCWVCYRGYDANTNTIGYQLRTNSTTLTASDKGYRYRLWFTSADGTKRVPANLSTATDATTARTLNTRPINPFGSIIYYGTNGTTNAGAELSATTQWEQYTLTIGYTYVITLTDNKPVYVQCTPQSDGSAVMNTITQTLPSTEDGKIYIFLGYAYSTTAMELRPNHPVYYYKDGAIRFWTNAPASSTGQVQANWNETDSTSAAYIQNKPTIPDSTSDLTNDSNFVADASYVHTDNNFTTTLKNKLDGIASGAEVNVQANWNETSTSSDAYILNKPTIPTALSELTDDINNITLSNLAVQLADNVSAHVVQMLPTGQGSWLISEGVSTILGLYTSGMKIIFVEILSATNMRAYTPTYVDTTQGLMQLSCFSDNELLYMSLVPNGESAMTGTVARYPIPSTTSDLTNDSGYVTLDEMYPVGSVYITSTNSAPIIGGTWELIDKEFTSYVSTTSAFTINTTNTTSVGNYILIRKGHEVILRLQIKNKVALSKSNLALGTINTSEFGISSGYADWGVQGNSDGGTGLVMASMTEASSKFTLTSMCAITRTSGGSIAAGNTIDFVFRPVFDMEKMLDSACNKFYWKRTA